MNMPSDADILSNQQTVHNQLLHASSEEIAIRKGIRQSNPYTPKLFTATIQEVFRKMSETVKDMEKQLNLVKEDGSKISLLKVQRGKTIFININSTDKFYIDRVEIERVLNYIWDRQSK